MKIKRIGFFAGVFDPIHDGHIEVARSAVKNLSLNHLYFLVEEKPWTSKEPIDISHRRQMIDIANKGDGKISQLELDDKKFDVSKTLVKIEEQFPNSELYFIFGADVFMKMNQIQWPKLDAILKHYIVVFERNEVSETEITEHAKSLGIVTAIIPSTHPNHSSTDIRLKSHDKSIWVPEKVAEYIDKNSLYV